MKRLLAIALLLVSVGAISFLGSGASNDSSNGYEVRAIFRNAFSVIPGEDVRISGVPVGVIKELEVTPDQQAAVVLSITEPGFQDFRRDAECTIRPQSLIGEKFIECTPTQPREQGADIPPALPVIGSGPGKGQRLLPVSNTSKPIDLDLVGNTLRLPIRQRLTIILNELGATVAARGADLKKIIRQGDPALKQTDRVLAILAKQNEVLSDLARDSDKALAPVAAQSESVANFIDKAGKVSTATAQRREALEEGLSKLPEVLRQLDPTLEQVGSLSDQITPNLRQLNAASSDINRVIEELGPFSEEGVSAVKSLGDSLQVGREALVASKPLLKNVRETAAITKPVAKNLAALTESIRDTGGIERLMDALFYQATSANGYDANGHYLRARLITNTCTNYEAEERANCQSKFTLADEAEAASASASKASSGGLQMPAQVLPGDAQTAVAQAGAQTPAAKPTTAADDAAQQGMLDYLLGDG